MLLFSVQFFLPSLISSQKEATDSPLIASVPTAVQCSDKGEGQQSPQKRSHGNAEFI